MIEIEIRRRQQGDPKVADYDVWMRMPSTDSSRIESVHATVRGFQRDRQIVALLRDVVDELELQLKR